MSEERPKAADEREARWRAPLGWVLLGLVVYRLAYHFTYLGEVPFALGTFSDGSVYETAARDILDNPPWGTKAFYLQGLYAYLLALGMIVRPWIALALILQLGLAFFGFWLFHRAARDLLGRHAARLSTIALMAYPALAFYENKFLSASLGIFCNILVLFAWVKAIKGGQRRWSFVLGCASALALMARPNLLLALPFTALTLWISGGARAGARSGSQPKKARSQLLIHLAIFGLGLALTCLPMMARNLRVTGAADLFPTHGGGTSFFIGNNPQARGVWNDAGVLSARLGAERSEMGEFLGDELAAEEARENTREGEGTVAQTTVQKERAEARVIGRLLYARAFEWIRQHPWDYLRLQVRKLWLIAGNEELTQDYDLYGERELLPWSPRFGLPFGLLLGLAFLGWRKLSHGTRGLATNPANTGVLKLFLAGQLLAPLAANFFFFTSAQHRLPLVVPLCLLVGAAGHAFSRARRGRWALLLAFSLTAQGFVPRSHRRSPHPVHYYNLAMVEDAIGDPVAALASLDRAIELSADQPLFYLRRAHLRFRLDDGPGALADVERVQATPGLPQWLRHAAEREIASIRFHFGFGEGPLNEGEAHLANPHEVGRKN